MEDPIANMLSSIRELTTRVENLENENIKLRELLNTSNNNNNNGNRLMKHIQSHSTPTASFKEWTDYLINNIKSYLEIVYENDLFTGVKELLKDSTNEYSVLPIIAFNRKPNVFYYYNDENAWTIFDNSDFDKLLDRIDYWFIYQFNECWLKPNLQKVKDLEEYKDKYDAYYLSILGGMKVPSEVRHQRLRHYFYKLIREPVN